MPCISYNFVIRIEAFTADNVPPVFAARLTLAGEPVLFSWITSPAATLMITCPLVCVFAVGEPFLEPVTETPFWYTENWFAEDADTVNSILYTPDTFIKMNDDPGLCVMFEESTPFASNVTAFPSVTNCAEVL